MIRLGDIMTNFNNIEENVEGTGKRGGSRKGAGRKPIGVTRKISLTLPQQCWGEIDRYCRKGDYSVSEILRSIIEDNLHNADLL